MTEPQKQTSRKSILRITLVGFLLCLVGLIFLAAIAIRQQVKQTVGEPDASLSFSQRVFYEVSFFVYQGSINQPSNLTGETIFTIESGEPLDMVIAALQEQGIISDRKLLRNMLVYTGADRRILPGKYQIPGGSSLREVAWRLQDINASLIDFVILPGWRKEEIAEALPTSGLAIPMDKFLAIVNSPLNVADLVDAETLSHEGFLAPGRYLFRRDISTTEFINAFVDHSRQILSQDLVKAYANHGLTTYQAVILASIIQREAVVDEEKPLIASVFLNRLAQGMPLQSDPTAQYALGFNPEWGWWKSPLSLKDLTIESPFNTYIISELPPAPISNPDESSLRAVAFPMESTFLYFRASCDNSGKHVFSNTIEEHTMNACPDAVSGS
jgi:UPF0755 protein